MVTRYTYNSSCPNPTLRFHIEHTVQDIDPEKHQVHTHDFAELILVRHGSGRHVVEDREYPLTAGDVFVLSPGQIHGYRDLDRIYVANIMYDPEIYLPSFQDTQDLPGYYALFHLEPLLRHEHAFRSRLHLNNEQMLHVYDLLRPLEEEYMAQRRGYKLLIRSYFTILVTYLSRQFSAQETTASRELHAISRVIAHIESRYAEEITLQDLADVAHMSRNSLLRAFNRCYGTTPIEYLNRSRLDKARELLTTTHKTITDIAFEVGFSDSNYFATKFRQTFTISPRAFREGSHTHESEI